MWCSGSIWIIFIETARRTSTLIMVVIVIALMPFTGIELMAVHSFDMFPQRTGICVSFGTSRSFTSIGFLKKAKQNWNVIEIRIQILLQQQSFMRLLKFWNLSPQFSKMATTLLVPSKLTFSYYLSCLNLALLVGVVSQKRLPQKESLFSTAYFLDSGQFKHHK